MLSPGFPSDNPIIQHYRAPGTPPSVGYILPSTKFAIHCQVIQKSLLCMETAIVLEKKVLQALPILVGPAAVRIDRSAAAASD